MQILRFGTCQICLFYILLVCSNITTPNCLSTAIAIQLMTVAIGGSFVFYTNFNHYKKQYSNFSNRQLILMDAVIHIIPLIHVLCCLDKYVIRPIPIESILIPYIYGIVYFRYTDVRNVYIDFSPQYIIVIMIISNCITTKLIECF